MVKKSLSRRNERDRRPVNPALADLTTPWAQDGHRSGLATISSSKTALQKIMKQKIRPLNKSQADRVLITMKTPLLRVAAAMSVAAAAFSAVSCAYDPYYGGGEYYGGGYSSGYYGGSSASIFVSTGDPRWGYDPYRYAYYDYTRRAYYDPYLYGYYPVGFLPPRVYGMPHPYGWRPGNGYCPPPRVIRGNYLSNYQNRYDLYRSRNFAWSRNIRPLDNGGRFDPNRFQGNRPAPGRPVYNQNRPNVGGPGGAFRPNTPPNFSGNRPQYGNPQTRPQFQPGVNRPQFGNNQAQFPQTRPQYGGPSSRPQFQPQTRPQYQPGAQPQFQQGARPQFQPGARPQFQQGARPQFQPGARPQFRQGASPQQAPPQQRQRAPRNGSELINSQRG